MNELSDTKRLAEATTTLASTLMEIINGKLQTIAAVQEQKIAQKLVERVLTVPQAAEHFQVCRRTIENWMERGHLPYYRIGRVVRIKLSEVEAWWSASHRVRN
jgi:excisionase family DNA binding protein